MLSTVQVNLNVTLSLHRSSAYIIQPIFHNRSTGPERTLFFQLHLLCVPLRMPCVCVDPKIVDTRSGGTNTNQWDINNNNNNYTKLKKTKPKVDSLLEAMIV